MTFDISLSCSYSICYSSDPSFPTVSFLCSEFQQTEQVFAPIALVLAMNLCVCFLTHIVPQRQGVYFNHFIPNKWQMPGSTL